MSWLSEIPFALSALAVFLSSNGLICSSAPEVSWTLMAAAAIASQVSLPFLSGVEEQVRSLVQPCAFPCTPQGDA